MKTRWLMAAAVLGIAGTCAFGMNGKAATIISLRLNPFWNSQPLDKGRLMVVTVNNNRVTQTDTILRGNTFFYTSTWSFDGTRIAFWQGGDISIIDADGQNLRVIARTVGWSREDQEQYLVWPPADGGKWIYYDRPCNGCFKGGSGEIWKVNVNDTAQKIMICDYKMKDMQDPTGWGGGIWKFSLSLDARYACVHAAVRPEELGYSGGVIAHTFPPQSDPGKTYVNPWLTKPTCIPTGEHCASGDCNSALSPSGKIMYHFSGSHTALYACYWDHAAKTMTNTYTIGQGPAGSLDQFRDIDAWLTSGETGDGLVYPRGSCNSDQIVLVNTNWSYGADLDCGGNNQIVANWKDKEAVLTTNNPKSPAEGTTHWFADIGDFRLEPPAGVTNCYEDIAGNWVSAVDASIVRPAVGHSKDRGNFAAASAPVTAYDLKGARLGTYDARTLARTLPAQIRRGVVVVTGQESSQKAVVFGGPVTSR